jgi:glyoxylase-like metal-dependent hydrolase (beta-lactamase superfamily II)
MRKKVFLACAAVVFAFCLDGPEATSAAQNNANEAAASAWAADLGDIRHVASLVPGELPLRINVEKFAESPRSKKFAVQGAPDVPSSQVRTAFQVVYADGTVMVDSGMNQRVHKYFGRGVDEPYYPEQARDVEKAVTAARLIVVTHEHGDHVAGVLATPIAAELARKTILTRIQVQTLETNPQMPEIRLTPEMAARYIVIDYDRYFPLAPGMALIKAPGHTPGSQMVYVKLKSGVEYLLAGDVAWHMDGVREVHGKDAPWVKEGEDTVMAELAWLNQIYKYEKNVHIVLSHDDDQREEYLKQGILGDKFE